MTISSREIQEAKRKVLISDWYKPEYQEANWYDMDFYQENLTEYAFEHIRLR